MTEAVTEAKLVVTLVLEGFGRVSYSQESVTLSQFTDMLLALREIAHGRIKIRGKELFLMERDVDGRFKAVT